MPVAAAVRKATEADAQQHFQQDTANGVSRNADAAAAATEAAEASSRPLLAASGLVSLHLSPSSMSRKHTSDWVSALMALNITALSRLTTD